MEKIIVIIVATPAAAPDDEQQNALIGPQKTFFHQNYYA